MLVELAQIMITRITSVEKAAVIEVVRDAAMEYDAELRDLCLKCVKLPSRDICDTFHSHESSRVASIFLRTKTGQVLVHCNDL